MRHYEYLHYTIPIYTIENEEDRVPFFYVLLTLESSI
jgi:hypothetical protein